MVSTRFPSGPEGGKTGTCRTGRRFPARLNRSRMRERQRTRSDLVMTLHQSAAATTAPQPFVWDDPFLLEDQLTEEERMIRDAAAAFAADRRAPKVEAAYLEERTDPELFREMGEAGLLGVTIPEEFGGAGAGYVS